MRETDEAETAAASAAPRGQINTLHSLRTQGRFKELFELGEALAEQYPADPFLRVVVGSARQRTGRPEEAIACFKEALAIRSDFALAHSNLCALLDKQNKDVELEDALSRARQQGLGDDSQILVLSAKLSSRKKDFKETLATLDRVRPEKLPSHIQKAYHELLGKTYDRLGQFDKAFEQFDLQNKIAKRDLYPRNINPMSSYYRTVHLTELWSSEVPLDCDSEHDEADEVSLAFLVGFPRSGTTLLDTILRGHPEVAVVEEHPMVNRMRAQLAQGATVEDANKKTIGRLTSSEVSELRATYLEELSLHVDSSDMGKLIVDKYPLNLRYAGLIHRVFPKAKFILALRHPCDCVLSCFMQNFNLNPAMANFLDLDQSARFYAAVMELWQVYRKALDFEVYTLRYEDLIHDLRGICVPLIEFLGLEWDDILLNYRETARSREYIRTPSYDQVIQPLYRQASGRWENYRKQMEPVLPVLEPWIKEFGYAD